MKQKIRRFLQALQNFFTKPYYRMKDYLRYYKAVQLADEAHEKDSDRYYVMGSTDEKLIIVDRKNFRLLKRKGYISKAATIGSLIDECFYYTGAVQGSDITDDVRKKKYSEYKNWCKAMRMIKNYN